MNNLLTTLAFSIYSNKGVYALLLGSGISKKSGIPTGWDVVIDLCKKLAVLNKEDCGQNPEQWFINKYGETPDYSTILSKLVSTPSERINLLRPYFEPNEQEREEGLKQPTQAHISIAKLIKAGYIKVVITTNFDRLLEAALQNEGIEPVIIRHADDIGGAIPLVHNSLVIIKINGDYQDNRFLNTKNELADYPEKLKRYVLQIINEFGLISCGWSGKWDEGLINTIRQAENFRFGSFWTYIGNCEPELAGIALSRKGQKIEIQNADIFFTEIFERVSALEQINDNHPLNVDIALARLKKYIVKKEGKILLHDLLFNEQEIVYKKIQEIKDFHIHPDHGLQPRINNYEQILDLLLPLCINGIYWSKPDHEQYFIDIISRLAEPNNPVGSYYPETRWFHYYPATILLYSLGITAIKSKKFSFLNELFQIKIEDPENNSRKIYLIEQANSGGINKDVLNQILNQSKLTPFSDLLSQKTGPFFNQIILNQNDFEDYFDIFEYFLSLNYFHFVGNKYGNNWVPWGRFKWRNFYRSRADENFPLKAFFGKADEEKDDWLPIKSGMFNKSYNDYVAIKKQVDKYLESFFVG
jgi:hypothetical protein